MSLSPLEYLRHMLDEAGYLVAEAENLSEEEFLLDETMKRAFVRSLEVIGEAAKKIPAAMRKRYPHVEWRAMAGMRDKLRKNHTGMTYLGRWLNPRLQRTRLLLRFLLNVNSSGWGLCR